MKIKIKKRLLKKYYKFVVFPLILLIGVYLGLNYQKNGINTLPNEEISAKELNKKLKDKNFTFINVHTPYEGEIEQTDTFITYDEIVANKERLPQDKNSLIILYCESGNMSGKALETLKNLGYTNVAHLNGGMKAWKKAGFEILDLTSLPSQVLPEEGFTLPVSWGNYGPELIKLGVIDKDKFESVVQMTSEEKEIISNGANVPIKIDATNSQFVVDLLWALGLAQESIVYKEGPMGKEYKDTAGNFASTGGWNLAKGDAVNYLGKFNLINLSTDEQERVGEISKNVYRPCCGNNTWFPDCNHGMAALAAIELMVKENLSDEEIYKNVLKLNSFWFSENTLITATYFARQGITWDKINAKEILGEKFSSAKGASEVAKKVGPLPYYNENTGGSCGS